RADDEIEFAEPGGDPVRLLGRMLTVGVENQDEFAIRVANSGLHRGAVSLVVGMSNDTGSRRARSRRCVVGRTVVAHTNLPRPRRAVGREDAPAPMASASFMAGMTIEMLEGSAKQLLDHTAPRDRLRDVPPCGAEPLSERPVSSECIDGRGERGGFRLADES